MRYVGNYMVGIVSSVEHMWRGAVAVRLDCVGEVRNSISAAKKRGHCLFFPLTGKGEIL